MKTEVQIIKQAGKPAFAVVPIGLWERMRELAEDAEDTAAIEAFRRADDGFRVPHEVVKRQGETGSRLLAWREHRKLTQDQLAAQVKISKPYLSQMETGKRKGTMATFRKLAQALNVPVDVLAD